MRHVGCCEIIGVHLVAELGDGGVDEECWIGAAGAAPDDIWRGAIVLGRGFDYDSFAIGWGGQVCADVVELLSLGS